MLRCSSVSERSISCAVLSWVSSAVQRLGGRPAAGAHRALEVAGHPLVRAADVERWLVGAVQRSDRLDVTGPPARDVALGPGVGAPEPGPRLERVVRLWTVHRSQLLERLTGAGPGVGGHEGG